MPTVLENLVEARDNISARIVEVTENPAPNYDIDGKEVAYADYLEMLLRAQRMLTEQIMAYDPYQYVTQVV